MMKLFILTISTFIISSCSNDYPVSKIPSVVQNAVKAKFPGAINIDWEKNTNEYQAEFNLKGIEHTVYVDTSGNLLSFKHDIKVSELPAPIISAISTVYTGYKIDDTEKIEKDNVVYYQAELESKKNKDLQLIFSADGKLATQINYLK